MPPRIGDATGFAGRCLDHRLHLHVDRIHVRLTATQGGGILGDLLCAIADLLNGGNISGQLAQIVDLLNQILGRLRTI